LADVALVFCLLGCLAVVVLTRIFLSMSHCENEKRKESHLHVE
jgi:hypothetical protein